MFEREIRQEFRKTLIQIQIRELNILAIDELEICNGQCRADFALVGPTALAGFEIKSDRDTLKRLARQVDFYARIFQRITLIVAEIHLQQVLEQAPQWCGITAVRHSRLNTIQFLPYRSSIVNRNVQAQELASLLWRDEIIRELRPKNPSRKRRKDLQQLLAASRTISQINRLIYDSFRSRKDWQHRLT